MSTLTENYNLIKPASSDNVNIEDINNNMDAIDEALNNKSENTHGHQLADSNITGILPVSKGGTGATSATQALSNLSAAHVGHLHELSGMGLTGTLPIATSASSALSNLGAASTSHTHALTSSSLTGTLPISKGGTGATSATAARTSLGAASSSHTHALTSSSLTGTLPISKGGTGATTQSAALTALGIKAGGVGVTIPADQDRASIEVTFDTPYEDSGYAVMILPSTSVAGGTYGRTATFGDKTATGFMAYIGVNNKLGSSQSSGFTWATIPYVNQ